MIKFFITLLLLNVLIFADANGGFSIDMQISRIKNAPARERVKLMNAFKQRVYQMNYEDRSSAIRAIQAKLHARRGQEKIHSKREMKRREIIEHASQRQTQNSDEISSYQNMNQQQIKNLIASEKIERKGGKVSKFKIVKQILNVEMEQQDRVPSKQNIKILKEQIKELQVVKTPNKQIKEIQKIKILKEQIKEIQIAKRPDEQIKDIQNIKMPKSEIINQISDTNKIEPDKIKQNQQVQEFYLNYVKKP